MNNSLLFHSIPDQHSVQTANPEDRSPELISAFSEKWGKAPGIK
jgi:hypothetical protein